MNYKEHYNEYKRLSKEASAVLAEMRIEAEKEDHGDMWIKWKEYLELDKKATKHYGIYRSVQSRRMNKIMQYI